MNYRRIGNQNLLELFSSLMLYDLLLPRPWKLLDVLMKPFPSDGLVTCTLPRRNVSLCQGMSSNRSWMPTNLQVKVKLSDAVNSKQVSDITNPVLKKMVSAITQGQ